MSFIIMTAYLESLQDLLVSLLTDSVLSDVCLELPRVVVVIVSTRSFLDKLRNLHVDYLVFLGNLQSILLFL